VLIAFVAAFVPAAQAHSPHDVSEFVSVADDGTILSEDSHLLAWSVDGGASFTFRWPDFGTPVCAFAVDVDTFVVATEADGAWVSVDGGASFSAVVPDQALATCVRTPDAWLVAGAGGVWTSADGVDWTAMDPPPGAVTALAASGELRVVALDDGTVARWDGAWSIVDAPAAQALAGDADGFLLAGTDGALWRSVDGTGWALVPGAPADLRVLAKDGATWLGATATEAVWVTGDDGATWTLDAEGLDPLAERLGGPWDGIHYEALEIGADGWHLAGWEGAYGRAPGADHWRQYPLQTIPRVTSLQWLPGGDLLLGVYGGGMYRGTPGGTDWQDVSTGVGWPFPRQVVASDDDTFYLGSGSALYATRDGGATWAALPVLVSDVGNQFAVDGDRIVSGGWDEGSKVTVSEDAGATFGVVTLPGACGVKPEMVVLDGLTAWVGCGDDGRLFRSDDGGWTWAWVATLDEQLHGLLPGSPVLLATDDGILTSDDDGATFTPFTLDGHRVEQLSRAPDGTIWASVPGSGLVRIADDGSVEYLGWPALDRVDEIAFADDGRIAVGLRDGAWWSDDGGATWALACAWDRYDDADQSWWWDGWDTADLPGAKAGSVHVGDAGAHAEWIVTGEGFRLDGVAGRGGTATVTVDDTPATVTWAADEPLRWTWAGDAGPHFVSIDVTEGRLTLDGGERWRTDPPSATTGTPMPQPGPCGSGCGGGGAAWVLVPGLVWRRRWV
jgi:hypothetical protein